MGATSNATANHERAMPAEGGVKRAGAAADTLFTAGLVSRRCRADNCPVSPLSEISNLERNRPRALALGSHLFVLCFSAREREPEREAHTPRTKSKR